MKKILEPNVENTQEANFETYPFNHDFYDVCFQNQTLKNITLQKQEWNHCIFRNIIFENVLLENVTLMNVVFEHCDLSNLDFSSTTIHKVKFVECKLVGSDFSSSSLQNVIFYNSVARYSNFSFAKMKDVLVDHSDFTNGIMNECTFKNVFFTSSRLQLMEFLKTPLKGIDLRSCEIEGIKLSGPELFGTIVTPDQAIELSKLLGILVQE